jgi:DNA polymerase-3 subunit gamma/tau
MRQVADGLLYRPLGEGTIKAIIVDECHMLSKSAWNSLLKIIEHPPEWGAWLFATTEPVKVPNTIRTRCLCYDLKPVSQTDLYALLDTVAHLEKMKLAEGVAVLCVKEAEGSPRQALANLGICANAKSRAEAAEMLRSASEKAEAIDLARALVGGAPWPGVQALLKLLSDTNPESIRHVVRAYVTKVILDTKSMDNAGRGLEILDAFSEPFHGSDGISPVLLACGKVLLGEKGG